MTDFQTSRPLPDAGLPPTDTVPVGGAVAPRVPDASFVAANDPNFVPNRDTNNDGLVDANDNWRDSDGDGYVDMWVDNWHKDGEHRDTFLSANRESQNAFLYDVLRRIWDSIGPQ